MRSLLLVAMLSTVLAACAGSDEPTGGIAGHVVAGPTCPVETVGSPCPPRPWTGMVRATAADGTTYETQTDTDGAFRLPLPPGSYSVTAVTDAGGPPSAIATDVTVVAGSERSVDLEVDTGIR